MDRGQTGRVIILADSCLALDIDLVKSKSRVAPWRVTHIMYTPYQARSIALAIAKTRDGRTDGHQTDTLRLPLDAADVMSDVRATFSTNIWKSVAKYGDRRLRYSLFIIEFYCRSAVDILRLDVKMTEPLRCYY